MSRFGLRALPAAFTLLAFGCGEDTSDASADAAAGGSDVAAPDVGTPDAALPDAIVVTPDAAPPPPDASPDGPPPEASPDGPPLDVPLADASAPPPDLDPLTPDLAPLPPDDGVPDERPLVGGFSVQLIAPVPASGEVPEVPGFTAVSGRVNDGPTPALVLWDLAETEGDCRLVTPRVPFCAEGCPGGSACVGEDTCLAYPSAVNAGVVHTTGLRTGDDSAALDLEPVAGAYQAQLPYPAFDDGDALVFEAAGGDVPAFTLTSHGIAPLGLTASEFPLQDGQPMPIAWNASAGGHSEIHIKLDISHHGGSRGQIECLTADDGAFELPAALLGRLLDLGVAGFPTVIVARKSIGVTNLRTTRVELLVQSVVERPVLIEGLVSCFDDADCAPDQTCQPNLTCR